jgi:hypothetical protein
MKITARCRRLCGRTNLPNPCPRLTPILAPPHSPSLLKLSQDTCHYGSASPTQLSTDPSVNRPQSANIRHTELAQEGGRRAWRRRCALYLDGPMQVRRINSQSLLRGRTLGCGVLFLVMGTNSLNHQRGNNPAFQCRSQRSKSTGLADNEAALLS